MFKFVNFTKKYRIDPMVNISNFFKSEGETPAPREFQRNHFYDTLNIDNFHNISYCEYYKVL